MAATATTALTGLSEEEARARLKSEGSRAGPSSTRSLWAIARTNLFTFFNNLLFAIGVALIALGQVGDALASVGLGLVNALIGAVQEARAKRKLDRISLLNRPTVTVVRDGRDRAIDPAELVRGDLVRVEAGDQVLADGAVVGEGRLEMDESLLTGESDLIVKRAGDRLLSGSFCVTGEACYEAEQVGAESFADRVTRTAREFRVVKTPLQQRIEFAVRLVTVVVALMSLAILLQAFLESLPLVRIVQFSAVLSGQVPYGLFFMAALAYTLGAATLGRQGALVQQVNAIESLSNVDVLCMDKTGTLTANRLRLEAVKPLGNAEEVTARLRLGEFVRSLSTQNGTSLALAEALPGEPRSTGGEVAFSSARKWSALAFDDRVWALGAIERLTPYFAPQAEGVRAALAEQAAAWTAEGLRVLVFARSASTAGLDDSAAEPQLPELTPVALVALSDELRPGVTETLAAFAELSIRPKVISGDDPETVAALARRAGIPAGGRAFSGTELAAMSPAELEEAATEATVFGRVTPDQKEALVDALTRQGKYVAMMGDGVNDAMSLKRAKLGIAMESGSSVTRNVADMVLLGDSFESLQPAFSEGRRIVAGLSDAMFLFLTRVATSTLLILAIAVIGLGFPYEPAQVSLTLFTVGIPSFFLTLWARPEPPPPHLLRRLARFVLPAAIVTAIVGTAVYTISYEIIVDGVRTAELPEPLRQNYEKYTGLSFSQGASFTEKAATIEAQTVLSAFVSISAFVLILLLKPPARLFTAWTTKVSDRRPAVLALVLFVVFVFVVRSETLTTYFGLVQLGPIQAPVLSGALIVWFLALSAVWRWRLFERILSVEARE